MTSTTIVTFSRPGALPHATVRSRVRMADGQPALIEQGSSFEILRGNLCGAGTLRFTAPPRFRPGDWVRVYLPGDTCLPGDPADHPRYLGEAVGEPWEVGEGEIALRPLTDRVLKAAWRGDVVGGVVQPFTAPLKPYFEMAWARCRLPPGITLGTVSESTATFRSVNPFERLDTTVQTLLPGLPGGAAGVDARGRFHLLAARDEVAAHFFRARSDRPPGRVDNYANCVRLPYARPDGVEAFFEFRAGLEVAVFGEAWAVEALPTGLTVLQDNPYAALGTATSLTLQHPDLPEWQAAQNTNAPVFSPSWGGKLSQGADLGVLYGTALTLAQWADSAVRLPFNPVTGTGVVVTALEPGLQLEKVMGNVTKPVSLGQGAPFHPTGGPWREVFDSTADPAPYSGPTLLRYTVESVNAYANANGRLPPGFRVGVVDYPSPGELAVTAASSANPVSRRMVPAQLIAVDLGGGHTRFEAVPRPFGLAPSVRLTLPVARSWRAGDVVTTDAAVTRVQAELNTNPPTLLDLTRGEDDADTGRRVWVLPQDYQLSTLIVSGDPAQIGWIGVRLADQAGLLVYATGLLRHRVQPVRGWKGTVPDLRRLDVDGMIRFDTPEGDEELDFQKATYDLGARETVLEAGTPWPADDDEAIANMIESVERSVRRAG
ncbi:hypothetical protein [Deinococcus sp. NW-56]|uniref:hypothetical protein n=1 Tax=Deinococcus sp. NW-56 TaxID=2080419 RepID=UPI000CF3AFAA|nr:hypothetical protein [Deinococcus sp. NW-56]